MTHQHANIGDTVYFWFAANDTSGSGGDGATPLYDVREAGAAAGAAPLLSGTPTLLTHANYPAGCHEISVAATVGNGFADGDTFGVFCTLAIDSQNPSGFVGSCTLNPIRANAIEIEGTDATDQINAACDAAIETYRLDELMTAALSAQPTAASLFADLTEDDGGTQRFSSNALEQAWQVATRVLTAGTNLNDIAATDVWAAATRTLTAGTNLNDLSEAQVNAQVDAAIETYRLDELFTAALSAQPTVGSLLADLTEDDGGTQRFTVNALENAPSGSGASAAAIADAVWDEAQADHVAAGSFGLIASEIANIEADTNELQTDDVPGLIAALNDPTAATIADAVWDELQSAHVTAGSFGEIATEIANILTDTNELQTDDVPGLIAALNDLSAADVNAQVDAALNTAIPGTPTAGSINDVLSDLDARLPGAGTLSTLDASDVNAEVLDVLNTDTFAAATGAPSGNVTILTMIQWMYTLSLHSIEVTASQIALRNAGDTADIATATHSDDDTTYDRGPWT